MQRPIHSVADLGLALRAVRKSQGLRLDDLAGSANVSHVFVRDVEHGKDTVRMGSVLKLLEEAGIKLIMEMPSSALPRLESLQATGLKPLKPRISKKAPQ